MVSGMQTAIYARISKDDTTRGLGVARQVEDAEKLAKQRDWEVTETLIDNDISASGTAKRPAFEKLLTMIESGEVAAVIAWALDRLTRNRRDTMRLIDTCQKSGAMIALVRGSDLDMGTPAGRLTADLLAAVARSEWEQTSDRILRSVAQAADQGRPHGGRRPFGWEPDGITPRPEEQAAIREGANALLAGARFSDVAHSWNEAGLKTPQSGDDWCGRTVLQTLRKPRMAGLRTHQGKIHGPAAWEPVIDRESWERLQVIFNDPTRRHRRPNAWLLTRGIATCGRCGEDMQAGTSTGSQEGKRVPIPAYKCSAAEHMSRRRDRVEAYVEAIMVERLRRPDAADLFTTDPSESLAPIVSEMDQLRHRRDSLAEAFADGVVDLSQMTRATRRIDAQLEILERRLERSAPTVHQGLAVASAEDVGAAWAGLPTLAKADIIGALASVVIHRVRQGTRQLGVEVVWK